VIAFTFGLLLGIALYFAWACSDEDKWP